MDRGGAVSAQEELIQRGPPVGVRVHQETTRDSRIYTLEFSDGVQTWREPLWSVTTLLKVIDRPALQYWAAGATARAAYENLKYLASDLERYGLEGAVKQLSEARFKQKSRASDIGDGVHRLIEAHILGATRPPVDPELADEIMPRFSEFLRWEEEYQPTYRQSEATVFHAEHGWAGTLDFIAEIGGRGEGVVDVKNTNPGRDGKPGVYGEHALQVAAYANAAEIAAVRGSWVEPIPMAPMSWGAVLWLYRDRHAFIEVKIGPKEYEAFRVAAQLYRYVDGPGKKAILGPQTPATFGILPTPEQQAAAVAGATINEAQRKRMLALGNDHGLDHAAVKAIVLEVTGATSTTKVPRSQYDAVCARIEGKPDEAAA